MSDYAKGTPVLRIIQAEREGEKNRVLIERYGTDIQVEINAFDELRPAISLAERVYDVLYTPIDGVPTWREEWPE